jgi:peptidyl-tRNA hydrolase
MERLYVLVRQDLSSGARIAQALHGLDEYRDKNLSEHTSWRKTSNTVAVLGVRDETHLAHITAMTEQYGIPHAIFREPDMGDAQTVLVLGGNHPYVRKLTAKLPLLS